MEIIIRNADGRPIYDQIYAQIRQLILSGRLAEGEALPSLRELARELRISVITTKRAYEDLERDGFIHSVPGKGSFVAPRNAELAREETLRKLEERLGEILELCESGGISEAELADRYRIVKEER